jgi:hypothetical protein
MYNKSVNWSRPIFECQLTVETDNSMYQLSISIYFIWRETDMTTPYLVPDDVVSTAC